MELESVSEVKNVGTVEERSKGTSMASSCYEKTLEALRRQGVMAKVMCMLSVDDLMCEVPLVCTAWRKAAILAYAEVASDMGRQDAGAVGLGDALGDTVEASQSVWSSQKLVDVFPWGSFLSEGACKQVNYRFGRKFCDTKVDNLCKVVVAGGELFCVRCRLRIGCMSWIFLGLRQQGHWRAGLV